MLLANGSSVLCVGTSNSLRNQVRFVYFEAQMPLARRQSEDGGGGVGADGDDSARASKNVPRKSMDEKGKEKEKKKEEAERPLFCVETASW